MTDDPFEQAGIPRAGTDLPGGTADRFPEPKFIFAPSVKNEETALLDLKDSEAYLAELQCSIVTHHALTLWADSRDRHSFREQRELWKRGSDILAQNPVWKQRLEEVAIVFTERVLLEANPGPMTKDHIHWGSSRIAQTFLFMHFFAHLYDYDEFNTLRKILPPIPRP